MGVLTGSPPTTSLQGFTPWMKPPGYDFSSQLYDYMRGMIGQPAPQYGGWGRMKAAAGSDGGANKYLKLMSGLSDRFMDTGMPAVFGQATGALNSFLNPNFMNPSRRVMAGGAPDFYGGGGALTPPAPPASGLMSMLGGMGQGQGSPAPPPFMMGGRFY